MKSKNQKNRNLIRWFTKLIFFFFLNKSRTCGSSKWRIERGKQCGNLFAWRTWRRIKLDFCDSQISVSSSSIVTESLVVVAIQKINADQPQIDRAITGRQLADHILRCFVVNEQLHLISRYASVASINQNNLYHSTAHTYPTDVRVTGH